MISYCCALYFSKASNKNSIPKTRYLISNAYSRLGIRIWLISSHHQSLSISYHFHIINDQVLSPSKVSKGIHRTHKNNYYFLFCLFQIKPFHSVLDSFLFRYYKHSYLDWMWSWMYIWSHQNPHYYCNVWTNPLWNLDTNIHRICCVLNNSR